MSKYTTELRFVCEMASGLTESAGYDDVENIVETAAPHIFNNYPIFDEQYRPILEKKILMHYYTREICEETVGLWKLRLAARMNEIMPYFNKLYESELLKFNPLFDVDVKNLHTGSGTQVGTDTGSTQRSNTSTNSKTGTEELVTNQNVTKGGTDTDTTTTTGSETNSSVVNGSTDSKGLVETATDGNANTATDSADKSTAKGTKDSTTEGTKDVTTTNTGDTTTEHRGTVADSGSNSTTHGLTVNTTDKSTDWKLYSDTPQGTISDIMPDTATNHNMYLTNATEDTHSGESETTNSGTDTGTDSNLKTYNNDDKVKDNRTEESNDEHTDTTTEETTDEVSRTGQTISSNVHSDTSNTNSSTNTLTSKNEIGNTVTDKLQVKEKEHNYTIDTDGGTTKNDNIIENNIGESGEKHDNLTSMNTTDEYAEHIFGKRGYRTYSAMLKEFRETFLNIDELVINKLSDLFFGLW